MADRRKRRTPAAPDDRRAAPAGRKTTRKTTEGSPARRTAKGGAVKARAGTSAAATKRTGGARRSGKDNGAGRRGTEAAVTTRLMRIRELDPQAACGPGTTVMQLFRVDDLPFGNNTTHLVFFDRHGWYCEHGRECPAVAAVRKHEKHVTLTR
jgi:hypothetical protein